MATSIRSLATTAASLLLLASRADAHFKVAYPPTVGPFMDDAEASAPCGGYNPDLSDSSLTVTDFHVDGDAIATNSGHPQTDWLYRVTTDPKAAGNWTQVFGIVQQNGPSDYCQPMVTVDHSYVGQKAILGIVANGADGLLYQCAAVMFVNGTGSKPDSCTNSSSVTGSYTSDDALTSQLGDASASSTSSSPSSTDTPSAGYSVRPADSTGAWVAFLTATGMAVLGAALMV
ncbi:hypothetical protein F4780DRAFT_129868 [Xylariomycetidae sp. FL0641]|nr:hypothetical protein F4780DRAFT_129868 [Xylariomycetidae sp. FL0641]